MTASFAPIARGLPPDLRSAFVECPTLIDVRAPVEFAQGALPGAVNLPVLDDVQRAAVGVEYKTRGAEAAVALGRSLVSGDDLERKMASWIAATAASNKQSLSIYCFRGGLRSQSVAAALRAVGVEVSTLEGGYKRARRALLETLERAGEGDRFAVITGFTGSRKTELIQEIARGGGRAVDLEGRADHRGSAFGGLRGPQRSQASFENAVAVDLLRVEARRAPGPIALEDESRRIGRLDVPAPIFRALSSAPLYAIESAREERARHIIQVYLADYALEAGADSAFASLRDDVTRALFAIERRLGGAETRELARMAHEAIAAHARSGNATVHLAWTERLLGSYYDPLYASHLAAAESRIVVRGDYAEIKAALASASFQRHG